MNITLKGGDLVVFFDEDLAVTYMEQLPVEHRGMYEDTSKLCDALGLTTSDLLTDQMPIISPSSVEFIYIAVNSPEVVKQLSPNQSKLKSLFGNTHYFPYVFSPSGLDVGDVRARMFAPTAGIPEDPATGSAQSALVHAMDYFGLLERKDYIKVEQGYEMGRPSILHNRISYGGENMVVKTGGACHLALQGKLYR